ncbi:hypothetical protein IV505_15615 [Pseudomonas fulva]|nr:CsiV family protein [Pseudomonas fulva]MBF8781140.1 hypothetical protein [Pseudomonas fulva]
MRTLRNLIPLLALYMPAALAEGLYKVEMILLRQNSVPAVTTRIAAENWSDGARRLAEADLLPTTLDDQAERLRAASDYTVLLHQAWQQPAGSEPVAVALVAGEQQFGRFPIEGTLALSRQRFIAVQASFRVNQLDGNGGVLQSEAYRQQNSTIKANQLTFLDGGHLALLLKIAPVGTRTTSMPSPVLLEQ